MVVVVMMMMKMKTILAVADKGGAMWGKIGNGFKVVFCLYFSFPPLFCTVKFASSIKLRTKAKLCQLTTLQLHTRLGLGE